MNSDATRIHVRVVGMIDERSLNFLELYLFGKVFEKLNRMKIPYKVLIDTPPEFSPEYISDPLNFKKYQYFVALKSCYKEPLAIIITYILEKKLGVRVLEIYYHDFVAGSPAWYVGHSGRDIDFVFVVDKKPPWDALKTLEEYLDDVIGSAITYYYCIHGQCDDDTPFNRKIRHNLVEIHAITPDEKPLYNLDGALHGNLIEKADINKIRKMLENMDKLRKEAEKAIRSEEGVKIILSALKKINELIKSMDFSSNQNGKPMQQV